MKYHKVKILERKGFWKAKLGSKMMDCLCGCLSSCREDRRTGRKRIRLVQEVSSVMDMDTEISNVEITYVDSGTV